MFKITKNRIKGICCAFRCKNKTKGSDRFCSKHRHRFSKQKDIVSYTYYLRQSRAKERGHSWDISLKDFRKWCKENNYIKNKGKKAGSASIDRIDPNKGYTYENMQVLSLSDNSVKMHEDNKLPF